MRSKIKYYDSIENMPIWNFHKTKETKDLKYMVSDGIIKKQHIPILENVFLEMSYEYTDELMKIGGISHNFSLLKTIALLELDYFLINRACHILSFDPNNQEMKNILSMKGYPLRTDNVLKEIKEISRRSRNILSRINIKNKELQLIERKQPTEDFGKKVQEISKFLGRRIDVKKETVKEFIDAEKFYYEYIKEQNASSSSKRHN